MSAAGSHLDTFTAWGKTLAVDVAALRAVVESSSADAFARRLAAAGLSYLVSRMDLIPDWNEAIGTVDDFMILRVASQLLGNQETGELGRDAAIALGRMGNEAEKIAAFLGAQLYEKLRAYVSKLPEQTVRGRTAAQIVEDEAARAALFQEVAEEVASAGPISVADAAEAELRLKAYLTHKLS